MRAKEREERSQRKIDFDSLASLLRFVSVPFQPAWLVTERSRISQPRQTAENKTDAGKKAGPAIRERAVKDCRRQTLMHSSALRLLSPPPSLLTWLISASSSYAASTSILSANMAQEN